LNKEIISSEEEVRTFLRDIKGILIDPLFNIDSDLDILPKKKFELPTDPYTTANTLQMLEFDRYDVYDQLMALDISEYIQTVIDDKDCFLPPFYAFNKSIKTKDVYIKVKIRDRAKRKIFCVSFHFARYPVTGKLPYL